MGQTVCDLTIIHTQLLLNIHTGNYFMMKFQEILNDFDVTQASKLLRVAQSLWCAMILCKSCSDGSHSVSC